MSVRTAFNIFTVVMLHSQTEAMKQLSDYYISTKTRNIKRKDGKILYAILAMEINLQQLWRLLHS
jgi:hypothetical protein